MKNLRQEHPNPQCMRKKWKSLNGEWEFSFDKPDFSEKINVPFSWATELSGINKKETGIGWYKKYAEFNCGDNRVFLNVGALCYECDIFVNQKYIGHYFSGYTPIYADVTDAWKNDFENEIIIRVQDGGYCYQPNGKTYSGKSGIWQSVWLEERPKTYIESFKIRTFCSGVVKISAKIIGNKSGMLTADFEGITASTASDELTLYFQNPKLWSPDSPYLYDGKITLETESGTDEIQTYFGIREIGAARFDNLKRKYITLNGKPVYINSCLDQSCTLNGFTESSDEKIKEQVMQMKSLGLNSFRIHIKPEDPRKLYYADKIGMLVIEDMPVVGYGKSIIGKMFYEKIMTDIIERDFNHPSIFMWVLFNETWGLYESETDENGAEKLTYPEKTQKWVVSCYKKAKAIDNTRIIDDNSVHDNDRNHTVTDVNSWHLYANGYERLKKGIEQFTESSYVGSDFNFVGGEYTCPDVPVLNCECGNYWDYFVNGNVGVAGDSDISWQYKYMMNEFRLHDEMCGFVFTEFRDVINEFNGYFRIDGTIKEFGYEEYVPQMTVADLHSQDFLAVDCSPMKTCTPCEIIKIPLVISSFTDINHNKSTKIKWELVFNGAVVKTDEFPVDYSRYGCTFAGTLEIKLPEEDGIAVLRLYLIDEDTKVIMRNFVIFDMQAKRNVLELENAKATGFTDVSYIQCGNKINCIGNGKLVFTAEKNRIPGYTSGKDIYIRFEASSKEVLTKDRENIKWTPESVILNSDHGVNPNTYYQTDNKLYPSEVKLSVGDINKSFQLLDAPADSRGCLSWHYQAADNKNEEAGSYGYLCEMKIDAKAADKLEDLFTVSFFAENSFSLYGRSSGRYPVGVEMYTK